MTAVVDLRSVTKCYVGEGAPVEALHGASLTIAKGEFVAVMGQSGCGKSTLLHIIGAMDRPTQGEVWLQDQPLHTYSEEDLTHVRRTQVGFVFQFFYLLPTFTVEENVGLPLLLTGASETKDKIAGLLERVGLAHRRKALPRQLSGGEMQRVAIARAVIHEPALLVADEPTGNLDSTNGEQVLDILQNLSETRNTTIVMATHSEAAASHARRTIHMKDGRIL
jgi:putative ABC transport system ATP-binding protein